MASASFRRSFLNPKPSLSLLHLLTKPFSNSASSTPHPSSLSARLSFVFDQIDAIEKERSQKHETLQRIRAWRQSQHQPPSQNDDVQSESAPSADPTPKPPEPATKKDVELVHPWPEWIQFMEMLVHQNYFDHRRMDEDKLVHDLGFNSPEVADDDGRALDLTKDFKSVHNACLNFGKDRFDILRSLSRQDIQVLVGFGCPTVDKKVVFSAKLLRKRANLDEGDVCSSCSLRNNCERAYLITNKEDEARTIDVMRLLLTFGFDPINGSVVNTSLLKQKSVRTVVRKLLHEVVKLGLVPIDPNLPPPVIKKAPPKVKQPPPPPKKRVGRDDVEMKKGDWLCPKCEFMNFAKNTVCLQCDAKRPKRQLLPGEWECPECNFLNYRRNMVCFHCECKRPPDEFLENKMHDGIPRSKPKLDMMGSRQKVSNAWNFDFDDNESDGADVAAFEYADSHAIGEDSPSDNHAQHGNYRKWEEDFEKNRMQGSPDGEYANLNLHKPRLGFDDFEDEDEDDIDSYELETQTQNSSLRMEGSKDNFSEAGDSSELEDIEDTYDKMSARNKTAFGRSVRSRSIRRNSSFSGSEDELDFGTKQKSVLSNFKSGHISATDRKRKGSRPTKKLSYGSESEEDIEGGLYTDEDDDLNGTDSFRKNKGNKRDLSRQNKGNRYESGRKNFTKDRKSGSIGSHKANMFRDDFDRSSHSNRNGRGSQGNSRKWKSFDDFDGSSRKSSGNGRGSRGNKDIGSSQPANRKGRGFRGDDRNFKRFEDRRGHGRVQFNKYSMDEKGSDEFRNSRRVIER